MECKARGGLNGQDRVEGSILNWLFHCGIAVWNHTLLLSIVQVIRLGVTYKKYCLMAEGEEMPKVPATESESHNHSIVLVERDL